MKTLSKFWADLQDWMKERRLALAGILVLAGCAVLWAGFLAPWASLGRLEAQWREAKSQVEETRQLTKRLRQGSLQELPSLEALPEILEELHAQARAQQVEVRGVAPGSARSTGADEPSYLPIELQVEGAYASLGRFLGALQGAQATRAIFIQQIRVSRDEAALPRLRVHLLIEVAVRQPTHAAR